MGLSESISFVETEPTHGCPRIHDDCFSFQPNRGWVLAQRLCFWFLRRIKCYHYTEYTTLRRIYVDRSASLDEIMRQQAHLYGSLGRGGELLLIGADDWTKIIGTQPLMFGPMTFDGDYFVPNYWGDNTPQRRRMRICVIPWMRGMVLVPREALDRKQLDGAHA